MTIQVRSNEKPVAEAPKTDAEAPKVEAAQGTPSAPEANASEQESTEASETPETEAEEGKEAEPLAAGSEEGQEPEGEAGKDKTKKKSGFQKRVDKLNQRVSLAQQEAEYWKREALKTATAPQTDAQTQAKPAAAEGKPKADDFDTHSEYVEALTDWKTEQKLQERDQKLEKSRLETERGKLLKTHVERVNAFAEKNEGFQEAIDSVEDIMASPAVTSLIVESENGPALMYELAKNREEFQRICNLPPLAAAREMGKIEARIAVKASDAKDTTKKLTQAPKPIAPVGTGGKGSSTKSIFDSNLSQSEYERLRREQAKQSRRQA